jgi:hypothetical protein
MSKIARAVIAALAALGIALGAAGCHYHGGPVGMPLHAHTVHAHHA